MRRTIQGTRAQVEYRQTANLLDGMVQKLKAKEVREQLDVGRRVVQLSKDVGDLPLLSHRQGNPDLVDMAGFDKCRQPIHTPHWPNALQRAPVGACCKPADNLDAHPGVAAHRLNDSLCIRVPPNDDRGTESHAPGADPGGTTTKNQAYGGGARQT